MDLCTNFPAPTVRKAVLLAAGRGTRMRELTLDVPKPMLPVRGKPILEHIVTGLQHAGVEEVLIVVGYRADVVRDHFGDGAGFGLGVRYVTQATQDGTGRVVELARPFVEDQTGGHDPGAGFILSYGDILTDPANYRVLAAPGAEDAIVTVKRSDDVSQGGAVFVDEHFNLTDLREKPKPGEPTSPWYNAGVYFFRPSLFDFTARLQKSVRGEYELTDAIRALAQSGRHRVRAYELTGEWADVRDPEVLAALEGGG